MTLDVGKILSNVSSVKLPGGVVGKTCYVLIVASLCIFGLALATRVTWILAISIVIIFLLVGVMLWKLISFANKNPQAALLEGAEFILHEKIQLASKYYPNIPFKIEDMIEGQPSVEDKSIKDAAQNPDQEVKQDEEKHDK